MNLYKYEVIFSPADGLMLITHPKHGRQLWARCKMRGHKNSRCAICGAVVGFEAFRPVTNGYNRMERICIRHQPAQQTGEPISHV